MTTEPNNNANDAIDELAGTWFDSESTDRRAIASRNAFTSKQARRMADLQLLHSLLLHLADRDELAKTRQVRTVMERIESTDRRNTIAERLHRSIQPLVRYGIAAMLVIAAAVLFMKMPSNTAMAAVDQMIAAIDSAADRTYSIKVEDMRPDPSRPQPRREPGERAGLDGATLYLRGNDRFVLYSPTPSGRTMISGSDGQTRWLIRPNKPVLVSNDPEAFRIQMPPEMAAILSLDLKATLLHIRDHYKVTYLDDATDNQIPNGSRKHLNATKLSRNFPGPKNISILADTKTGLLLQIVFTDIHLDDDPAPKRLVIMLVDQKQLSDDWFTRQAHHSQDAQVDFLSE